MASKRRSAERWEMLVSEWECGGRSATEFARERGLNVSTLRWWRWKLRGEAREDLVAPTFFEVVVDGPEPPDLVVELGDVRVHVPMGFDAGELRRLVAALC